MHCTKQDDSFVNKLEQKNYIIITRTFQNAIQAQPKWYPLAFVVSRFLNHQAIQSLRTYLDKLDSPITDIFHSKALCYKLTTILEISKRFPV